MDRQIEELINHELEMQNKKPIQFASQVTSDEEDSQDKEDMYQMVVVKGAGGGMK